MMPLVWKIGFASGLGAPVSKELVADGGKAILIASIDAFTPYKTILEYCNGCNRKDIVQCYLYKVGNCTFFA